MEHAEIAGRYQHSVSLLNSNNLYAYILLYTKLKKIKKKKTRGTEK
jgi:hypothetical protein